MEALYSSGPVISCYDGSTGLDRLPCLEHTFKDLILCIRMLFDKIFFKVDKDVQSCPVVHHCASRYRTRSMRLDQCHYL